MAKSSSFFGLRTGSTKSLTFQVLRGKQITKDRVTKVTNPQSEAQMRQRALIPMVAAARSELAGIVNHSWEGVNYGEESLRYFSKVNLTAGTLDVASYACKNISNPGIANFIVSKGSIGIKQDIVTSGLSDNYVMSFEIPAKQSDDSKAFPKLDANTKGSTVIYYLAKYLQAHSNDQLSKMQFTFLNMLLMDRVPVSIGIAEGEQAEVLQSGFSVQRIVLPDPSVVSEASISDYHDDNDTWFLSTGILEGGANSAVLEDQNGNKIAIDLEGGFLDFVIKPNGTCVGSAMIMSQLDGKIWRRSNSRLTILKDKVTPKFTFTSWFTFYDKAQIMRSEKYLNNGSQLPNVNG